MVLCFVACRGDNDHPDGAAPALADAASAAVSSETTEDAAAVPTVAPTVLDSPHADAEVAPSVRPASGAARTLELDPVPLIAPSSLAALGGPPGRFPTANPPPSSSVRHG